MVAMSLQGVVLAGRYELGRHLAEGGMGAVVEAHDRARGMPVAVKLMRTDSTVRGDLRARFEREARAASRLEHPNVVRVLDYGTEEDLPFLVMELLQGIDLLEAQSYAKSWPLAEVAELVRQIASGLAAAHSAGIVHRDVKPSNVFLVRSAHDGSVVAKLIDFGIAKWADDGPALTATNVALGSPSYMSPEQIRGLPIEPRVDAWALAVLAFTLVTGELPFAGRNGPEIARNVVMGNRRRIVDSDGTERILERFFARAFAPHPSARHASVEELARDLAIVAGGTSPLFVAERALSDVRERAAEAPPREDDARTSRYVRRALNPDARPIASPMEPLSPADDLEITETDDRLIASEDEADRTR